MKDLLYFGLSTPTHRSNTGTLLSSELEKISDFLRRNGLIITEWLNNHIIISHPRLFEKLKESLVDDGFQPTMLGATLSCIRKATNMTLAENRILEALSPGSLVVVRGNELDSDILPVLIPDNNDLRDIAFIFNGVINAFMWQGEGGLTILEERLRGLDKENCNIWQLGILKSTSKKDTECTQSTVVRVLGPGNVNCIVEGSICLKTVKEASNRISLWEIEDWT